MKDFLRGVTSVINLFPPDRDVTLLPTHSDTDAIKSDWEKVGKDMQSAADKYHVTNQKSHEQLDNKSHLHQKNITNKG